MNRIKELRQTRGWRQEDLAAQINVGKGTVSKYEKESLGLDSKTVCALCRIFGVTADYLLCLSDIPNSIISEEDAALLRAYHAADERSRAAIDALLAPLPAVDKEKAI